MKTSPDRPRAPRSIWRTLLALLGGLGAALAALILVVEEWGWRPLTAFAARLARWPPLARLESRIRSAPPRIALALFMVPATLLFPLKLAALGVIERGHPWLGILIIVGAKVVGTACVGRLFIICEPQLMSFPWFARALLWWRQVKQRIRVEIRQSQAWQALRRTRRSVRTRLKRWWRRSRR